MLSGDWRAAGAASSGILEPNDIDVAGKLDEAALSPGIHERGYDLVGLP